jgi:alpha-L-rhamnosidase
MRCLFYTAGRILFAHILTGFVLANSNPLEVLRPRTEYKINPIGIGETDPRLSWEIAGSGRNVLQAAYQIRASRLSGSLETKDPVLWDTGRIDSKQSIQIEYGGPALTSCERIYWQVRVWDNHDRVSAWSEPAFFETGLLHPSDWQAVWIESGFKEDSTVSQPCPMFRREFNLDGPIIRARIYVTSHGLYQLVLNGKRVGDQLFTPGWTSYNKRLQVQTYDVTGLLKSGSNAIGAILGDGWYRGRLGWEKNRNTYGSKLALLMQMRIQMSDGSEIRLGTDGAWKTSTGPILMSDIYDGEIYDARLEKPGWDQPGFNDSAWKTVKTVDYPIDHLTASCGVPVRRIQTLKPVSCLTTPEGDLVFDMGQNMVGWIRLRVQGPAGTRVTLRHAEMLDNEGNLYTKNLRSAGQTVQYILKGEGIEIYEPHFTFQGFRYVAVDGYPGTPATEDITGVVIHSDMARTGNFSCSDSLINRLVHNIVWGQKGNFLDVPTDCPQRDERMGWTGDAHVFARTACFNMDAAAFYTKWLKDLAADQHEDGAIPHVIPDVIGGAASSAWADAGVIIPWTVYLCYGDRRILESQYPSMKAWVDYMKLQAGDRALWQSGFHFGDWLAFNTTRSDYPGATTDKGLISTAFFAHSADLLRKTAVIIGKKEDAEAYGKLFEKIKQAFQKEYVTPNGRVLSNTQTAYALALGFDLLADSLAAAAASYLAEDVRSFKHITTGFVGTPLICHVLSRYGYLDLAYMLLNRKEYPSWLYPVTMGATTIWERWDGQKPDGSFQDAGMNSFNHYAYGAIGDWLVRVVAGIEIDEQNPGYEHIIIDPRPGGGLTRAEAALKTMYGELRSAWTIQNNFRLSVQIPCNTTASVYIPARDPAEIKESGKPLKKETEIHWSRTGEGLVLDIGSGIYEFSFPWRPSEN